MGKPDETKAARTFTAQEETDYYATKAIDLATPFEARHKKALPLNTNAQEAAVRVYNTGGILKRSDPHVGPMDRFGNAFKGTQYAEPKTEAPRQQVARNSPAPVSSGRAGAAELVRQFKDKVLERGGSAGIHSLGRVFRLLDTDDDRRLNAEELQVGLERYGLFMDNSQVEELIGALDKDKSGSIRLDEFLKAIKGTINARRQGMIDMAYKVLDKNGNGSIQMDDIMATYSTDHDADVLAGRLPSNAALENFLGQFDTLVSDGAVSRKEFTEYYRSISASIDNDDYFELMIRNAWHIPGGEGWCANTSNVRLLVVSHTGEQKVVCILDDLGLDVHDREAVLAALRAQGETDVYKFTLSGDI